ncbi:hypothetical protein [Actinoplanes utahensis]|uniref:DUF4034 domain-containing protein n=1 Tax=Actinoplanes utahensis TaxID=1869 RepID=A0A0A6ULW3_ACTUT|nr:hypothetical protein [Actinoplanes utahensis]KHD76411.1 hypothetical protein MB27_17010 [Actinoplanes utahensis]GIF29812.1 hypothetical protein Aut01nite_27980 [Actinoplanes utahensis]
MSFYVRWAIRRVFGGPLPATPDFEADEQLLIRDDVLRQARERLLRDRDWRVARDAIEAAGQDWALRNYRLGIFAGLAGADDEWFDGWMRAEPSSPAANLIWAEVLSTRAGAARGAASANKTSAEQFRSFQVLSEKSAATAQRALELAHPNDPGPLEVLMRSCFAAHGRGLEELYAEARRRDPHFFETNKLAVMLTCQKWYGSHELMFNVARSAAEAAPPGHKTVLLPIFAHFEFAMREFAWEDDSDEAQRAVRRYFARPEVQQDIDRWIARFRAAPPVSEQLSAVRQWMAAYYSLTGRRKEAKVVFDEIGPYVRPGYEWNWFWGGREYGYLRSWWWANGVGGA